MRVVEGMPVEKYAARCRVGRKPRTEQLRAAAPPRKAPQQRLGDWTERILAKVGITEDRYAAAKELFGLAPTCGCKERKEWLNKVSDWWRGQSG